jgi:glycolate oxidase
MTPLHSLLAALAAIVGREHASSAAEDRVCYGTDAAKSRALPDVVVRPGSAGDVSRILGLANARRIPVYPRGAGSGLTGGAAPLRGGIALEMMRMNRIISVDRDDMVAVVEPGVVLSDFQAAVERKGLFYPPDPASREFCSIGGTLAECAGGLHCVKYGVTRDYVLSAEAVLPTGEIIHTGSRTMKSVVGYDLGRLLVGSEGTLCVFTRATLRLLPLPESVRTVMAFFRRIDDAVRAAHDLLSAGIVPRTLEILDEMTIRCISAYKPFGIPSGTRAILLAESDGSSEGASRESERISALFESAAAISVERTRNRSEADLLWEIRRAVSKSSVWTVISLITSLSLSYRLLLRPLYAGLVTTD